MTQSVAAAAEVIATMAREPDTFAYQPSYHGHGSWRAKWVLAHNADGTREVATLSVHHFGSHKAYVAYLNRTQDGEDHGFTTEMSHPMAAARLAKQPVGRYSRKSHEAFARAAVAQIRSGEHADRAARYFDPSTEAGEL